MKILTPLARSMGSHLQLQELVRSSYELTVVTLPVKISRTREASARYLLSEEQEGRRERFECAFSREETGDAMGVQKNEKSVRRLLRLCTCSVSHDVDITSIKQLT
eukprot:scaffold14471_cov104-Skeletonema_marinoi.AAC.1